MEVEEIFRHAKVLAKHLGELEAVATSTTNYSGEEEQTVRRQL